MPNDDDTAEIADEPYVPGPRRSTFTPPSAETNSGAENPIKPASDHVPIVPVAEPERAYNDDELAEAMAEDFSRIAHSGPIPIVVGGAAAKLGASEEQRRLRAAEEREFNDWHDALRVIGTPEALRMIDEANSSVPETTVPNSTVPNPSVPGTTVPGTDLPETTDAAATGTILAASPGGVGAIVDSGSPALPPFGEPQPRDALSNEPLSNELLSSELEFAQLIGLEPTAVGDDSFGEPLSAPADTLRPAAHQSLTTDDRQQPPLVFGVEQNGQEPTALDQRVGRSVRLFWLWFAANSSVLSLAFGGVIFSLGISFRQTILAAVAGLVVSFLPLGLGTLAGKWSGQPTLIASRATFGVVGNVVPAALAVIIRLFWGAVLLWMIAAATARILTSSTPGGPFSEVQLTLVTLAVGYLVALIVAYFGYGLIARVQLVLSVASAALIVIFIAATWSAVDFRAAVAVGDGSWALVITGVVLVFSFVGLVWASSSGDLARYQKSTGSGVAASVVAPLGATLPAFILIGYGALLAASNPRIAHGLISHPVDALSAILPSWYPIPLMLATVLSLLSGVILSIYSGGLALQAVGVRLARQWSTLLVGIALLAIAIVLTFTLGGITVLFRDLATTMAVPVAAWVGLFAAEMLIRRRRFHSASLLQRGGVYPDVNWVNLGMLVVASVVGFGFTSATVGWLAWQGYLFTAFGVPLDSAAAGTDLGVLIALALGLLTPLVAGVRTVRRQENATR